jgi:hypothetical protein
LHEILKDDFLHRGGYADAGIRDADDQPAISPPHRQLYGVLVAEFDSVSEQVGGDLDQAFFVVDDDVRQRRVEVELEFETLYFGLEFEVFDDGRGEIGMRSGDQPEES